MQNDAGEKVDLYIPRKCSATNRLIIAKDHASIQFNIGQINANGVLTGKHTTYAIAGAVRSRGESDWSVVTLATRDGLIKNVK